LSATPRYYAAAATTFPAEFKRGCADLLNSLKLVRIWFTLGLNDVISRYRGSLLGPFWITLTTAVFVLGVGFLYAGLMKVSIQTYLPWMTTGIVIWGLISQTVLESSDAFVSASDAMRQTALPSPLFVWRVTWRNLLIFAHQIPVLVVVAWKFGYLMHTDLIGATAGLLLVLINLAWFSLAVAVVCARFRDLKQILASVTQLLFFLSPVLWIPSDVRGYRGNLMLLNPVVHMMNVIRGPLMAQGFSRFSALFLLAMAAVGWILALLIYAKVRRRIVHYV
jgi:ABC-type polysaccharide/polyol phosphate export permease